MNKERKSQKLFDIEIFTWETWDENGDYGDIIFYNVEFPYESMKQYNGRDIGMYNDGKIEIYSEDGTKTDWEGFVVDISEFLELIKKL